MPKVKYTKERGLFQTTGQGIELTGGRVINSTSAAVTAAGPSSPDVSNVNVLLVNTTDNNVTLGGLTGGVTGQVVHIVKTVAANNLVLEDEEGDAQNFILKADTTLEAEAGVFTCVYDGSNWQVLVTGVLT